MHTFAVFCAAFQTVHTGRIGQDDKGEKRQGGRSRQGPRGQYRGSAGGVAIAEGAILLGEVRAADPNSLSISFEQVELSGKKTSLSLSIRAAMMPNGPQNNVDGVAAQTGTVIGMPGVVLKVDDSPQHASKFESSRKDLQLKQGLQLMLAVPE